MRFRITPYLMGSKDASDEELQEIAGEAARAILQVESREAGLPVDRGAEWSGIAMIEALSSSGGPAFNTIPKGRPGDCHRLVVVAIGDRDSVKESILGALVHVGLKCGGSTTRVLFWASKWQVSLWRDHVQDFRNLAAKGPGLGLSVGLKLVGSKTLRLL
jgi:hypothetical protein